MPACLGCNGTLDYRKDVRYSRGRSEGVVGFKRLGRPGRPPAGAGGQGPGHLVSLVRAWRDSSPSLPCHERCSSGAPLEGNSFPASFPAVYSLDGLLVFGLLFICTCAYFRKVPRLKVWLLSEKRGVWGVFYKAAVIGTRLHAAVAISCIVMAFYVLFIK
ncbi:protein kish-B [Sceloporus undulatus]|uniref:protein kish-B n=1 Tax=Sceloporus undulatus TaxID=8520 RepID=UPI001C4C9607|nr:protein kish-B [Sceloporus undulatus]